LRRKLGRKEFVHAFLLLLIIFSKELRRMDCDLKGVRGGG